METPKNTKPYALITGASSGIGRDLAFVYAKNGYNLILVARRLENLQETKDNIELKFNSIVIPIKLDLSKPESANTLFLEITNLNLNIETLVNNAGFGISGKFLDIEIERETEMITLNIITLTRLTKLFAKKMLETEGGKIVNIASTAAFQPLPTFSSYSGTKAYVLYFTESIAQEYKNTNLNFTVVCPGPTKSEFMETANVKKVKFFNMPTSMQVAEFTYKSSQKNKTVAIHGFLNNLMSFLLRLFPRKINASLASKFIE
jgi:short-subunit dehydrogenase